MIRCNHWCGLWIGVLVAVLPSWAVRADEAMFREKVAPILEAHCVRCHNAAQKKGKLALDTSEGLMAGGASGKVVAPGKPLDSELLYAVEGPAPDMPKEGGPLTAEQVDVLRAWIEAGAKWPAGVELADRRVADNDWWSLKPIAHVAVPKLTDEQAKWARTPIDAFIITKLAEHGMTPSPQADRRTLIRRLYYNLIGLPPTPQQVERFIADPDPKAYEKLVDELLASPRYGERWARHWLDVAHYGDTHGYDKDQLRPNAYPYRDYVIRSFNEDKSYGRFVMEQLAGDVLWPDTTDGVVATGFIVAGPWDLVGQIEVADGTIDKAIVRNLDRDDMVATTMNTFTSVTAQCARCHNHKFDPITQRDYYELQAVFAAIDRAERPYEPDAQAARRRAELRDSLTRLEQSLASLNKQVHTLAGPELATIDKRLDELAAMSKQPKRPEFGYHSAIEQSQDTVKWVQIDLGKPTPIEHIIYVGCHDDFNNIGAGFGFPVRYRIEVSDDPSFGTGVTVVADHTGADVANPGTKPLSVSAGGRSARYVRVTATKLAPRQNDFIFALAELIVLTPGGGNAASGATVTSLDSIEAPVRWRRSNLVDGIYVGAGDEGQFGEIVALNQQRKAILDKALDAQMIRRLADVERQIAETKQAIERLPSPQMVYAAATSFKPMGSCTPTNGKPRPIHVLKRGSEKHPDEEVGPGTIDAIESLPGDLGLDPGHTEGDRRAALARWITDPRNPLTWRSIVNRIWLYHFGAGIVDTPNDFGRMGAMPTHPELLDWLAAQFRDGDQSLKSLHRLIVTSAVYMQRSDHRPDMAAIDGSNQYLWRMNRGKLEAEAVRDTVLMLSGKLDLTMYGPGFQPFGFKHDHSPHYKYFEHDPDDPASHRRSVYRFIVRSVPDPFMESLDCADPSLIVEKRNKTLTALQALALMNNKFMVRMAEHFAARVEAMGSDTPSRIAAAYRLAFGREPDAMELGTLVKVADEHGMANACRLIFNMNEFLFVN